MPKIEPKNVISILSKHMLVDGFEIIVDLERVMEAIWSMPGMAGNTSIFSLFLQHCRWELIILSYCNQKSKKDC